MVNPHLVEYLYANYPIIHTFLFTYASVNTFIAKAPPC